MVTQKNGLIVPILLALFVALLFGQSAFYGFVYDDHAIIESNSSVGDWGTVWGALTHDLFYNSEVRSSPFWRPLVTLSYYVDASIAAGPMVGHLTNLVLTWFFGWAFFRFLKELGLSYKLSLSGAVLLLCHPVLIEPAVNITSRTDLMAGLFCLLALRCEHTRGIFIFSMLALFSKEVAIVLPLMFLGLGKSSGAKVSGLAMGVYLALRMSVSLSGGLGEVSVSSSQVLEAGAVAWYQLGFAILPSTSTVGQSLPTFGIFSSILGWVSILGIVGACALRRKSIPPLTRLGVVIIIPTLLLVSGITGSTVRVGDGLLLFPVLGILCFLLATLNLVEERYQTLGVLSVLLISVWTGAGTAAAWRDDTSLWESAYMDLPDDPLIRLNYTRSIVDTNPELVTSILPDVDFRDARKSREAAEVMARALLNLGNEQEAASFLLDAMGQDVEARWANSAACLLVAGGLMQQAGEVCNTAFLTDPLDGGLRNALGVYHGRLGEPELAIPHFEEAVRLAPDDLSYLGNLRNARSSVRGDL